MGIKESLGKMIGIEEIEDEDIVTEEEIEEAKKDLRKEHGLGSLETPVEPKRTNFSTGETIARPQVTTPKPEERITMPGQASKYRASTGGAGSMKLIVIEPKNFEQCKTLVDSLRSKKPIIINLEKLETELAKQIFNFLNGAVYALSGSVTKVTNNIFIFAPGNVSITESKTEDTPENKGDITESPWT